MKQRDFTRALRDVTRAIKIEPKKYEYFHNRAVIHMQLGDWEHAIRDCESSLNLELNFRALAVFASILATCPDPAWRDGKDALKYATWAVRGSHSKDARCLIALAEAHAELGDFPQAVSYAQQSLELAEDEVKAFHQRRLEKFKAGEPYRMSVPEL
jgi:tetratricopeptide (TPR) repeat protein